MFTDLQGRFMGKRILPDFFLEEVLGAEGLHACLYLLAVDMEMEPLPGYAYASWDTGYGDFRMTPDIATLRLCPWIEKTAMVICDIADEETGEPVAVSPRRILKAQIANAAAMGYLVKTGSELEFYLFKDSFDALAERDYREARPSSSYIMDYHMLQTTKDEWFIRQVRNGMRGAGIPVEFSKGEFGKGQHEINITFSDALSQRRQPRPVQARRQGDRGAERRGGDVHGEMDDGGGGLELPRALQRLERRRHEQPDVGRRRCAPHVRHVPVVPRRPDDHRARDVVDVRAVRELLQALPARRRGPRRRSCGRATTGRAGYRTVGEHKSARVECRLPGADANPYLAFAATIASGMWGIRNRVEPPAIFSGNAYEAKDIPRVPTSLHEAIEAFRGSAVAREMFGDFVFEHLLNTAEQEQIIFDNQVVTDWELARYFERG